MKVKSSIMIILLSLSLLVIAFQPTTTAAEYDEGEFRNAILNANTQLVDLGIGISEISFFTIGEGRSPVKIHQQEFQWVPGDERRLAQDNDLTYMVDSSNSASSSGVSAADAEGAFDRSMTTWDEAKPLRKVDLVKRADTGTDLTIFDGLLGFGDGSVGFPYHADIVFGGFVDMGVIFGGYTGVLAFSVSFVFVNPDGSPSDIDGDQYIDTALNEIYFNDQWGHPDAPVGSIWEVFGWGIDREFVDVETVSLHEAGHSLGLGHFDGPVAVMNAFYGGIKQSPDPIDLAGMAAVYSSWPN